MKTVKLGSQGLEVSRIGLGCMSLTQLYGSVDKEKSKEVVAKAIDLGITLFDTADVYGEIRGKNETLVGKALAAVRNKVIIATKFGIASSIQDNDRKFDGSYKYVKQACEDSLKRLGTDYIDLYYLHRLDPNTPIEETIQAMAELVQEGKVKYLGVSEVTANILERANKIHPISAVQNEYSLWSRDIETDGTLQKARDLGIGIVSHSPLGKGFLTGTIKNTSDLSKNDWRKKNPRFTNEVMVKNFELIKTIEKIAHKKQCLTSEVALAWILAQGEDIIPIPGTSKVEHLESNVKSMDIILGNAYLKMLTDEISSKTIFGKDIEHPFIEFF